MRVWTPARDAARGPDGLFGAGRGSAGTKASAEREPRHTRIPWVKSPLRYADTSCMIISDEQVRLALAYLHTSGELSGHLSVDPTVGVTPEFVERVRREIAEAPETRPDRMEEARELLTGSEPSSREVADKMIGRIISDSIR